MRWFIIGAGIKKEAKTINVTQSGDVIKYEVQLYGDATATQNYDQGSVYMVPKSTGIPTNSLSFHFIATPIPTISSVSPSAAGAGETVQINGANFKPDAVADFIIDVIGDNESPSVQYISPTQLLAKIPSYSNRQPSVAQVYVIQKGITGYVKGPLFSLALKPTVPVITNLRDASGQPGDPVLIEGMSFKQPLQVHFVDQAGKDIPSDVTTWNECSVLTHVPDVSGIANPAPWKVYVQSGGDTSDKADFTFKPAMDTVKLDLSSAGADIASNSNFQGDNFDWAQLAIVTTVPYTFIWDSILLLDGNAGSTDTWTCDVDNNAHCTHIGGFWDGHKNDDEFFGHRRKDGTVIPSFRLKNGWTVESVSFDKSSDPEEADANMWDGVTIKSDVPKDCPYLLVHWWDSPNHDGVCYTVSWKITGPRGVPFK